MVGSRRHTKVAQFAVVKGDRTKQGVRVVGLKIPAGLKNVVSYAG